MNLILKFSVMFAVMSFIASIHGYGEEPDSPPESSNCLDDACGSVYVPQQAVARIDQWKGEMISFGAEPLNPGDTKPRELIAERPRNSK